MYHYSFQHTSNSLMLSVGYGDSIEYIKSLKPNALRLGPSIL
jgi:hypothetical protein